MAESNLPRLVIVGADKGGVGKTTITRALLAYCDKRKIAYRAVDTEDNEASLRRFHKAALPIDLARVAGQMRVFDDLNTAGLTIIDIRAGLLSTALKAMEDAGFFEDVAGGRIALTTLHVVDANVASLEELKPVSAQLAGHGGYIIARNQVAAERFGGADAKTYRPYFDIAAAKVIDVPHLDDLAAKAVDREGVSFLDFIDGANAGRSSWLRRLVNTWLGKVWTQFDGAGIDAALR